MEFYSKIALRFAKLSSNMLFPSKCVSDLTISPQHFCLSGVFIFHLNSDVNLVIFQSSRFLDLPISHMIWYLANLSSLVFTSKVRYLHQPNSTLICCFPVKYVLECQFQIKSSVYQDRSVYRSTRFKYLHMFTSKVGFYLECQFKTSMVFTSQVFVLTCQNSNLMLCLP